MPVGIPVKVNPRVHTLPLIDTLETTTAVTDPPLVDNEKSLGSNAPLPPVVLNTGSENVTVTVELFCPMVVPVIVGNIPSNNVTVLLDCIVEAVFPAIS